VSGHTPGFTRIENRGFTPTENRGFTLIEMMAVMLMVVAVTGVALTGYVDLSSQSLVAAELTRDARRATAVLDRVARDLEAARLVVKPDERDPLEHPWLFLAERRGGAEGANRLKFVTRGHEPVTSVARASDLAQVAWLTRSNPSGGIDLLRWSHPRLPDGLERNLPHEDDPRVFLVAEGIADFGVRFLDDEGDWSSEWDSSTVARSSQLPRAAEISVRIAEPEGEPIAPFVRRVLLPLRPIDLVAQLTGDGEGANGEVEDDESEAPCLRVRDCVDVSALTPDLMNVVFDLMDQCLEDTGIPSSVLLPECQ